jgi:hypothetical protein
MDEIYPAVNLRFVCPYNSPENNRLQITGTIRDFNVSNTTDVVTIGTLAQGAPLLASDNTFTGKNTYTGGNNSVYYTAGDPRINFKATGLDTTSSTNYIVNPLWMYDKDSNSVLSLQYQSRMSGRYEIFRAVFRNNSTNPYMGVVIDHNDSDKAYGVCTSRSDSLLSNYN